MKVTLYTDGAARGNPDGPGGYGAILQYVDTKGVLHEREFCAGYKKTTNNRRELMAVIAGLEALNRPCEVTVVSDSKYVTDAFNQHCAMPTLIPTVIGCSSIVHINAALLPR